MALYMSCFMPLVINIYNLGVIENKVRIWVEAWGVSFVVASPAVLVVIPLVQKLVAALIEQP